MKRRVQKIQDFIVQKWHFIVTPLIVLVATFLFFQNTPPKPPKIRPSSNSGFVFEAKNKNFTAQIGATKSPKPFMAFTSKTGSSVSMQMDATTETSIQEKDNKVSFLNVNGNTDVVYTPLANGIKEEIIINQSSENSDYVFDIVTVNATPRKTLDGSYSRFFYDTEGRYQFHLEKPFAVDGKGVRTEEISMQIRQSKEEANKYQIALRIRPDWLKSKDRAYPIVIDPTIITDTSAEFVLGTLNRLKDTGSGLSPNLETYYQELPVDQYTVGLWHFNEASGNALDSSGNSNTGTPTGTTVDTTTHRLGSAARTFNGTTDFINVGNSSVYPKGDFTLEAWIKTTTNGTKAIITHGTTSDWLYWLGTETNMINCKIYQATSGSGYLQVTPTVNYYDGNWHHLACTVLGTTVSLYMDGVMVGTSSTTTGTRDVSTAGNLYIGKFDWSTTYNFNGSLDEIRISNIARSAEEIRSSALRRPYGIFTSEVLTLPAYSWNPLSWTELGVATGDGETLKDNNGLVAQWNFNETSGSTATNNAGSCGASCNGTLTNFASTASQDQAAGTGWTASNRRWGAGALMFDGIDDYVNLSGATSISPSQITLETWFKPAIISLQNIIDKRNAANTVYDYLLQLQPTTGLIRFFSGPTKFDLFSNTGLISGRWYHLVTTFDGTTAKIYINGKFDNAVAYSGSLASSSDNAPKICRHGTIATGYQCNGTLDTTRIYSRVLTSSEILSNYQSGSIELQTRVGSTTTPDDGTWEEWRPVTSETQIESFDNYLAGTCTAVGGVTNDGGKTYIFSDTDKSFFSYTGADQTYTVPAGVTSLNIKMWGGGGGGGAAGGWTYGYAGGGGGYTSGTLAVTPGQTITVMVGAGGANGANPISIDNYGGGGRNCATTDCRYAGSGGGRSAIRIGSSDYLTAGGGGGGGSSLTISSSMAGGGGGGNSGVVGSAAAFPTAGGGAGGQASGGVAGVGNASGAIAGSQYQGGSPASGSYGGGGGGGWFGGGGGAYNNTTGSIMGGGGGGSGYIGGVGVSAGTTVAASGITQAQSTNPDNGGAGMGGSANIKGVSGRVVISPVYQDKSFSCTSDTNVEVLVVAGGGGGGSNMGGGGGGGGVIYKQNYSISANTTVPVIVGAGGSGAPGGIEYGAHPFVAGTNGENSVFGTLTAIGGGWGGTSYNSSGFSVHFGNSGGSGGGSSGYNNNAAASGAYGSGAGTAGQGFRGGLQGAAYYSGGGGGAGGAGADGNNKANGGIGIYSDILGTGYYWGGGGGGAGYSIAGGDGGAGGGGGGAAGTTYGGSGLNPGSPGGGGCTSCWTDKPGGSGGKNTGGGGGGGGHYFSNNRGGDGGSGIVIVRLTPLSKDAVIKTEGASSQKISKEMSQVDKNTVALWHMDEQAGSSYVVGTGSLPFATGGTVTYSGDYTIHTFYESGVFKVNGTGNVETLVVAGGGGGGSDMGGGGGGGGVLSSNSYAVSPANYSITVGAGGAGSPGVYAATPVSGSNGGNSAFATFTAIGGGGGGSGHRTDAPYVGGNAAIGGSGGGSAARYMYNGIQSLGAAGTSGQGYRGGNAPSVNNNYYAGGGGGAGGFSEVDAVNSTRAGHGGPGITSSILGTTYYFAAGGGGAGHSGGPAGNGGIGGGGGGSTWQSPSTAGTAGLQTIVQGISFAQPGTVQASAVVGGAAGSNSGSGGGGGNHQGAGGAGGSGIVVIRYLSSLSPVTVTLNNSAVLSSNVAGIVGNARGFDGTSQYIDAGSTDSLKFNLKDNFSISGWIYTVADSQDRVIAGNAWGTNPGYHLRMTTANQLRFIVIQDGTNYKYVDSATALSVGWHHVVGIWNGSTVSMYVDGGITGSQVTGGTVSNITSTSNFFIGNISGQSKYFKGSIDELKVSNVVLAAEEVAETYRMGRDKYINKTIPSVDLSGKKTIPFYIAADRPGAYLTAILGESDYANYQPDSNTVGLWHLDEKDRSGLHVKNSNSSSFTGAASGTTVVPGKIGLSRNFSAATNYISVGNYTPVDGSTNLTVDAWVFPTAQTAATHFRVFSKQFNIYVGQYGNQASFYMGNGTAWLVSDVTGGALSLNQWNHVTWVKSGTSYSVYINGQLTKSGTGAPATLGTNSNTTFIGSYDGTTQNWMGKIDEVRISNTARTTEEISQAYSIDSRSHPITIDFAAKIISQIGPGGGSSITSSSRSFGYSVTAYGESGDTSKIFPGDKVIIKGVDEGVEYRAQATVKSKTSSSITINSWDEGSTFPPAGFKAGSDVFKWQREYWNNAEPLDSDINAVTKFTLRLTSGNEGGTVWIDDLKSAGDYLTTNTGSDIPSSTGNFYLQYRAILTSFDENTSPSISSTSVSAAVMIPDPPSDLSAISATQNAITWGFTDNSVNETGFKLLNSSTLATVVTEPTPDITSIIETGLSPNTLYSRKVTSYNNYGNSIPSSTVSKYTLASIPSAPTVTRSSTSSTVTINSNTNPSTTLLAIYKEAGPTCDGSGGNYIAANGTDNGDTAVWRQLSSWGTLGTVTIPNQNEEIAYTFCLKAKNSENIETAFGQPGKSSEKIVPVSGDLTLDSPVSNSFLTRYRDGSDPSRYIIGLDTVGANDLNSSQLNINAGSVTINGNETLVAGKLIMGGGSLFLATQGAVIAPGAKLWTIDRDADGYPDRLGGEIKLWYGNDTPTSTISSAWFRRKALLSTLKTVDCNDNAYSATNSCCLDYTYYLDADADGYGSTTASVVCQDSPNVPPGYSANNTDCNDANVAKWQNINGYLDADGDNYGTGALTPACSGATLASGYSANNTDCNDANVAKWQNINGYLDADGDTYGAGALTPVCSGATLASGYSANASDCGPNTATAYPGSATCSSVSFLNAASATSYDYNCSGTDTVCGTQYYTDTWTCRYFHPVDFCYCADHSPHTTRVTGVPSCGGFGYGMGYSACETTSCLPYAQCWSETNHNISGYQTCQ